MENQKIEDYGIEGIYIIHAKKGYEYHEQRLRTLFDSFDLKYEFVTDGDPSLFSTINLNNYFTTGVFSRFSPGTISCTLNHILSYEKIVSRKNKYALVFENDPFFIGNFAQKIKPVIKEANQLQPGFIVTIENTTLQFPSYWQTKKNRYLYPAGCGRFAGAYLIDYAGAKSALDSLEINKCDDAIDWWINHMIDRKILRMYWAHPPLTEQGSHNGMLSSTISSKRNDLVRIFLWNIQKFYKVYIRRLGSQKRLIR